MNELASGQTLKKIKKYAKEVRKWAFGGESASQICDICSIQLANSLRKEGLSVQIMVGEFRIDKALEGPPGPMLFSNPGHYWVLIEDCYVVDLSGDQFDEELFRPFPRVFIALKEDATRHLNGRPITEKQESRIKASRPTDFY